MSCDQELKQKYFFAIIIGLMFISMVMTYSVIALFMNGSKDFKEEPITINIELWRYVFYILAFLIIISIRYVKRFILSDGFYLPVPYEVKGSISTFMWKLLVSTIVAYALCEAVALLGFALFLSGKNIMDFYPFGTLAICAIIMNFPRMGEWEHIVSEHMR